tara:strand:- start:6214 stop:6981 length:768 start_codon:yes stop_codon:yes gene_type:complete
MTKQLASSSSPARPSGRARTSAAERAERFTSIADAAVACFSHAGYKRTQVADIAAHLGASSGSLYLYVSGKEALFHLAVMRICDQPFTGLAAPMPAPTIEETVECLKATSERIGKWPRLASAATARTQADFNTFNEIGLELYDLLETIRPAIWLLDACAMDIPALNRAYRVSLRGAYLTALVQVISQGQSLTPARAYIGARTSMEIIAWAAMHRLREQTLPDELAMDEATIRQTAAQGFAAALMALTTRTSASLT